MHTEQPSTISNTENILLRLSSSCLALPFASIASPARHVAVGKKFGVGLEPLPLFRIKIVYSFVIEVADSKSEKSFAIKQ